MNFFKHNGVVVKTSAAPLSPSGKPLKVIVQGGVVPYLSLPYDSVIDGIIADELIPWERATYLEYRVHSSLSFNLIGFADREIRSKLYALNNFSESDLRLGSGYPEDKQSVKITTISDKIEMISLTQHWFAQDRPNIDKSNNTKWSRWILAKRKIHPFIYLGKPIDTTSGII